MDVLFFFSSRRRHTRYWRDWSSDVCSSDLAAHGTFRADNPMFSSILLDDGPLIVHDFERLGRAPYQLVLAGCDSGVAAPVGADELLGLVSSLMPLGAAGIVASIVPVNDIAVVPVMVALHDAVRRGAGLP